MRIDGMETGEAFLGNLLGSHAQCNILQDLHLRTGKTDILGHTVLSRSQQYLCHSLTDEPLTMSSIAERIADLREGRVFEQHAKQWCHGNAPSYKIRREVKAEEYPPGQRKALVQDLQLVDVVDVEKRIVQYHHCLAMRLELFYQLSLVGSLTIDDVTHAVADMHHPGTGDILIVSKNDIR